MDPFRDELAAAHAKIAQLEEEIRQLKGDHYPPPPSDSAILFAKQRQRNAMTWIGLGFLAVMFGLFVAVIFYCTRSASPPSASIPPGPLATSTSP